MNRATSNCRTPLSTKHKHEKKQQKRESTIKNLVVDKSIPKLIENTNTSKKLKSKLDTMLA